MGIRLENFKNPAIFILVCSRDKFILRSVSLEDQFHMLIFIPINVYSLLILSEYQQIYVDGNEVFFPV